MKILVVHAHTLLVSTLSALMQRCGSHLRVVHAGSLEEMVRIARRDRECAGVFVELGERASDVHAAIRELAACGVAAFVMSNSPAELRAALECGAAACLPCEIDDNMLLSALLVMLGYQSRGARAAQPVPPGPAVPARGPLTDRQRAVLRHLCSGDANKDIGRELHISEKTVKTHLSAIFKALGVSNRTQAVVAAREALLER